MAYPMAGEYTKELSESFLANLLNQKSKAQTTAVGLARKEGEAEGLVGQAATGSRVGAAVAEYDTGLDNAVENFNLDVAGKKREERLTDEERMYRDTERQKTEEFQKSLASMGYIFQDQQREANRKERSQFNAGGFLSGLVGNTISAGVGTYLGKKF